MKPPFVANAPVLVSTVKLLVAVGVGIEEPLPGGGEEEMNLDIEAPEEEPLGGVGRPKR